MESETANQKLPTNLDHRESQESSYQEIASDEYDTIRVSALNPDNDQSENKYNYIEETNGPYLELMDTPNYSEIAERNTDSIRDDVYLRVSDAVATREGDGYLVTVAEDTTSREGSGRDVTVLDDRRANEGADDYLRTSEAETTAEDCNGYLTVCDAAAANEDGYLRTIDTDSTQSRETDGYLRAVDTKATKADEGDGYVRAADREVHPEDDG